MKKLKKLTAVILAMSMTVTAMPSITAEETPSVSDVTETAEESTSVSDMTETAEAASEVNGSKESPAEDFDYEVNEDGESVTVTGYYGDGGDVVIPDSIDGKKVTGIGGDAFFECTSLTTVNIPITVTKIDEGAFDGCSALEEINVEYENSEFFSSIGVLYSKDQTVLIKYPEGKKDYNYEVLSCVKEIVSVSNNNFLKILRLPDELETIRDYAISGCTSLVQIHSYKDFMFATWKLPSNLKYLGEGAFADCCSLELLDFPAGLEKIGTKTFLDCTSLFRVLIPKSVTEISESAFEGCVNLQCISGYANSYAEAYAIEHSITFEALQEFYCFENEDDTDTVTISGYNGESTEMVIPEEIDGKTVTAIAEGAFCNNSHITSAIIPNTVTTIGDSAFRNCVALTKVDIPKKMASIGKRAFWGCYSLKCGIAIPDGITEISEDCFYGCGITSVSIPEGVTVIDDDAFWGCNNLTTVDLPSSLTKIGAYAFVECSMSDGIVIPDSVTEIGKFAFSDTQAKNIVVGKGVKKIGTFAFSSQFSELSDITFLGSDFEMLVDSIAQFIGFREGENVELRPITVHANKGTAAESATKRLGYIFSSLDGSETVDYSKIKGCTEVTSALYDTYSDFLTEYYVEKFPEAALEGFSCTDEEHEFFKTLTKTIIEDNPNVDVPEALYNWMNENICFDLGRHGYPIDVYRYKSAHCIGNAYLLCELMRCAGIPAVVSLGYVADMKNVISEYDIFKRNQVGHAWVFYYYDKMWRVADSAMNIFTSDRNIIANRYYITSVDGLQVKNDYHTTLADGMRCRFLDDGNFSEEYMDIFGGGGSINALGVEDIFTTWSGSNSTKTWVDSGETVEEQFGEEGWIYETYNIPMYLMKNGYYKNRSIQEKDGKTYWLNQNGEAFDITGMNVDLISGCPLFNVGDKFKLNYTKLDFGDETIYYSFDDYDPEIVSVEPDGTVTVVGQGKTWIRVGFVSDWSLGTVGFFELFAYDPKPYRSTGLIADSDYGKVTLSWNEMPNADYYVIKYLRDGIWIDTKMVPAGNSSVEITDLNPETEYTFAIDTFADFRFESKDRVTVTPNQAKVTTFSYIDNPDGTVTITGGVILDEHVIIPEEIDGKKVSGIAEKAFEGCTVMKSAEVPETIAVIGEHAFGFDKSGEKLPEFTLKGYENSPIYYYAVRYDIPFEITGKASEENLPYKEENKKEEIVETDGEVPEDVKPEDRITTITITPAFNMKNKDEDGGGFDLTNITVKAKEIYDEEGLERAEEALGTELNANSHYNLLDLTLITSENGTETDISNSYEGLVEVRIPIPTGHRDKTFYCFRINDNGEKEIIPGIQTEEYYIIYLEHFSLYALVGNEKNILGDINSDGNITIADARWLLQAVSGSRSLTDAQKAAADINGDGSITIADARWLLQAVSGSRVLK